MELTTDQIWQEIRQEAKSLTESEPMLASFFMQLFLSIIIWVVH
ncbi:Serine acetyltransferase [Bibersteinia trehalosi USDA-ARS-USMARC-189]|uniref:Serine acetyltransferase n=1 Tax=Bibersteinia trehalosi USDA-ARS-USMARC-189 TaxID=1263831 RepID=A0ABN4C0G9_BIBTR|nr:Serine acetyltransferase [Bibersteinia trehalosi USDA-ARS-USMARC-189]